MQTNLSRLASLFVSCVVHYALSSCLASFAILLCYQSILTVQMVLLFAGLIVLSVLDYTLYNMKYCLFMIMALGLSEVRSAELAGFDFENSAVAVDIPASEAEAFRVASHISVGSFSTGVGFTGRVVSALGVSTGSDNLGNTGYSLGDGFLYANRGSGVNTNGTQAQAFSQGEYFEVTLTPDAQYEMSFNTLSFYAWVNNKSRGADQFAVTSSIDGHSVVNILGSGEISPSSSGVTVANALAYDIDLTGMQFQGVTSATSFRIYVWDGGSNTSTSLVGIDNLVFDGEVNNIPEPTSVVLLGIGLVGFSSVRRRNRM